MLELSSARIVVAQFAWKESNRAELVKVDIALAELRFAVLFRKAFSWAELIWVDIG